MCTLNIAGSIHLTQVVEEDKHFLSHLKHGNQYGFHLDECELEPEDDKSLIALINRGKVAEATI